MATRTGARRGLTLFGIILAVLLTSLYGCQEKKTDEDVCVTTIPELEGFIQEALNGEIPKVNGNTTISQAYSFYSAYKPLSESMLRQKICRGWLG